MGVESTLKMRYVVKKVAECHDDGTRLFSFLRELTSRLLIEPVRVTRDRRLDQLVCVADSWLRNKSAGERFFTKRRFPTTHLPSLCKRYQMAAEVWSSCGEIGYDEHYVVDYNGKIVIQEDMKTVSWAECDDKEPTAEQKAWAARWGRWTIPTVAEYAAEKEHRRRFFAEMRAWQRRMDAKLAKKYKPGEPISTEDFFSSF